MDHFIWNYSVERVKLLLDTYWKCWGSSHNYNTLIYRTFKGCALLLFENKLSLIEKQLLLRLFTYLNLYCLNHTYSQIFIQHRIFFEMVFIISLSHHRNIIFFHTLLIISKVQQYQICHRLFESIVINLVYSLC